jgi:hypothetical protein
MTPPCPPSPTAASQACAPWRGPRRFSPSGKLHALKLCVSWSVTPKNQGYEVNGTVDCKTNQEIELRDMELIRKVDPLRVTSVCSRVLGGASPTVSLVVFVLRRSEPVVLEEQEIVHIQRKRKFWLGGSG